MSSEFGSKEELQDLFRQVIASNLTVAYQMELLKRHLAPPTAEQDHPFAHVLETFEMIREVLQPEPEDDEHPDTAELEIGESKAPSELLEGTPFESTLRYLKPRKKKPAGG